MAVMAREAWTDERLDDLARRMDRGFDRIDSDLREVKGEIRELSARLDAMQRTMIIGFASIVASTVASVVGAVIATQL
jgi:hypothetical protein